jgi:hypothetical protein
MKKKNKKNIGKKETEIENFKVKTKNKIDFSIFGHNIPLNITLVTYYNQFISFFI